MFARMLLERQDISRSASDAIASISGSSLPCSSIYSSFIRPD